jgi:ubiquinone/menaquinone biosynthesis C-methylase UbiE
VAAVVSVGTWKKWVLAVVPYLSDSSILEIGHGPGHLVLALQQMSKLVIGLDRSPQMSRIARKRLAKQNAPIRLILGNAQNLPLAGDSIDHIVATFPSEYIFNAATLAEAHRVLRPGGTFIILPFAWIKGTSLLKKAAAWLFKITGESPKERNIPVQPFQEAGFLATTEIVDVGSSKVLIIRAQKPPK